MNELKKSWTPTVYLWLGLLICAWTLFLLWPDRQYYFIPAALRVFHPHHAFLKSSGKGGLCFGIAATLLIVINLGYLVRKELIHVTWLGSLRSWMAFHVFTGLVAGAMVLLHSAMILKSTLGILAFVSMAIVLATGLIGRYIYAHTPRSVYGRELELDEIRKGLAEYQTHLEKFGMPPEFFQSALAAQTLPGSDKGMLGMLIGMAAGDRKLRRAHKDLCRMLRSQPALRPLSGEIIPLADRYCQEKQWLARYQELRAFMGSWRFFHRWFAIVLLVAVGFHIFIAFQMGNLWLADVLKDWWLRVF